MLLFLTLLLGVSGVSAQQESPLDVKLVVLKTEAGEDGKETLSPAAEIAPGQVLVYKVTYHNRGATMLSDVAATLPVPPGLGYIEASAAPVAAEASLDGKVFFSVSKPPKDATPDTWRVLRWSPRTLAPGAEFVVEVRARVLKTFE